MKRSLVLVMLAMLFTAATAGTGHCIGIEFAAGAWNQSPSGRLGYEVLTGNDVVDMESDLNYSDETRFMGRVNIDMPLFIPNIYLMGTPMEFEGNTTRSFTWEGITFPVNASSKLKLDHLDVALYYGIPLLETATLNKLNIDIGLNVRIIDLELTATEDLTSQKVSESYTLPIPMIFLALQFRPIEAISIEGEGRGLAIGNDKAYSLIGRLRWNAFGPLFVAGGYRYDKYDIDEEGVIVDADFSGPFGELGLSF